jgi:hypothetical protein
MKLRRIAWMAAGAAGLGLAIVKGGAAASAAAELLVSCQLPALKPFHEEYQQLPCLGGGLNAGSWFGSQKHQPAASSSSARQRHSH